MSAQTPMVMRVRYCASEQAWAGMSGGAGGQMPVCPTAIAPGKIHDRLISNGGTIIEIKNQVSHR